MDYINSFRISLLREKTFNLIWEKIRTFKVLCIDFIKEIFIWVSFISCVKKTYYNPGHNILEPLQFTTNKTKVDISYNKLGIQVKILGYYEILEKSYVSKETQSSDTVSFPEIKLWQQQSKNTQKQISNFSCPFLFYWISLLCFKHIA